MTVNTDHAVPTGRANPPKIRYKPKVRATLSDLIRAGDDFTSVPAAAGILNMDQRTVRRAIARGEIPATRVGTDYRIPVAWLAEQAGLSPAPAQAAVVS
jgi:excisionase family DNA binding protein